MREVMLLLIVACCLAHVGARTQRSPHENPFQPYFRHSRPRSEPPFPFPKNFQSGFNFPAFFQSHENDPYGLPNSFRDQKPGRFPHNSPYSNVEDPYSHHSDRKKPPRTKPSSFFPPSSFDSPVHSPNSNSGKKKNSGPKKNSDPQIISTYVGSGEQGYNAGSFPVGLPLSLGFYGDNSESEVDANKFIGKRSGHVISKRSKFPRMETYDTFFDVGFKGQSSSEILDDQAKTDEKDSKDSKHDKKYEKHHHDEGKYKKHGHKNDHKKQGHKKHYEGYKTTKYEHHKGHKFFDDGYKKYGSEDKHGHKGSKFDKFGEEGDESKKGDKHEDKKHFKKHGEDGEKKYDDHHKKKHGDKKFKKWEEFKEGHKKFKHEKFSGYKEDHSGFFDDDNFHDEKFFKKGDKKHGEKHESHH